MSTQLTVQQSWICATAESINTFLNIPGAVTVDGYVLNFSDDVPVEKLFDVSVKMTQMDKSLIFRRAVMRYNVGRLILETSARTGQSEDQVIIDCGLCERTKLSAKTLINWAGLVSRVPPNLLKPNVSWTTLVAMDCRVPDDPIKMMELRKEQERIVDLAAANPHEYTSQNVKREMKAVLESLGVKKKDEPSGSDLILAYAILLRKLRYLDETGVSPDTLGFVDRRAVIDQIEAVEASLVNMQIISATVA